MTAWLAIWLAEGCFVVCAAAVLTRAIRLNAATRYVAWWIALIAVGSFAWTVSPRPGHICVAGDCGVQASASEPLVYVGAAPDVFISAFLGIWLSITLVRLIRVLPSLHAVYSLRDRCTAFPPAIEAQLRLWLEAKAGRRRAELAICSAVQSATVLGFQRPCIAVPPQLLESLSTAELDHVILHEYAHVQRRDDWTRLAQTLVHSILWVHPAAALIGRQLDREREMACDEWVVARTGQPKVYARCLARAAEVLMQARSLGATEVVPYELSQPPYGLTPTLFGRVHDLVRRVDRLLGMRGAVRCQPSIVGALAVALTIGSGVAALRTVPLVNEIGEVAAPFEAVRTSSVLRPMMVAAGGKWIDDELDGHGMRPRAARAPVTYERIETTPEIQGQTGAASHTGETEVVGTIQALDSHAIAASYSVDAVAARPATEQPGTWSRVGATAVQIGAGASRAGVNIGNFFSRAGTSAARRF